MNRDWRMPIAVALVLAMVAALGGYYWLHKPLTVQQAASVASALADTLVAAWLAALGGGVGRRIVAGWDGSQAGERVAVQAALGWGIVGLFVLAAGAMSAYYSWVMWLSAVAASLWLWRFMRAWLADAITSVPAFWPADTSARVTSLLAAVIFVLSLLRALAPPIAWDALVYHLTLPKLYAETHGLRLDIDFMFSGMPQLAEMLYTAATLLRGDIAAQTLGWVFGLVLALGLAAHAATLFGSRLAPLAPALVFASFTIALSLSWAYVELLLMVMGLALLIVLRQWALTAEQRWLVLGGLIAGFAMGCKYTAAILPAAGGVVILARSVQMSRAERARPQWANLIPAAQFGITTFVVFLPWLVKNALITGNPVFPLAMPAGDMDALRQYFYSRPDLAERDVLWAGLIFFRAVFGGVQGGNEYDATLNPFLAILPAALLAGWRWLDQQQRREIGRVALFLLAAYVAWVAFMFISPLAVQARLFFGLIPALALVGLGGLAAISALDSPALRPSFIVRWALLLVVALGVFEYARDFVARQPLAYLTGQQSSQEYKRASLGWYAVAIEKINALPPGARVVFLWEVRSLDCVSQERCLPDVIIDRWWHLRRTLGSAASVVETWKAQGITHVLVYDTGVDFVLMQVDNGYEPTDWTELEGLRARLRLVEDLGGAYTLYQIP